MGVDKFDWILKCDDVDRLGLIDLMEDRSEGSRFARPGRAGDEHQAGFLTRDLAYDLRKIQPFQRGDDRVELPQHDGITAALGEDADTKPRLVGQGISGVARAA